MLQWLKNVMSVMIEARQKEAMKQIPGYLGRDLSQHRVHTTKYEDLCK